MNKMTTQIAAIECAWRRTNGPNPEMPGMSVPVRYEPPERETFKVQAESLEERAAVMPLTPDERERLRTRRSSDATNDAPSLDYWERVNSFKWVTPTEFDEGQG